MVINMGKRLIYVKKGNGGLPDFSWAQRDVLVTDCLDVADVNDGCIVLFDSGQTYPSFEIDGKSDIVIGSWGSPAVIDGNDGNGIVLSNCRNALVFGLRVRGSGWRQNRQGVGVQLICCDQSLVRNIEVAGFRDSGINIRSSNNITIEGCYAHDNGFCGICTDIGDNFNRSIVIRHCKVYDNAGDPDIRDNHSGSGIALFHTENGLVEYCEAAGNGWAQRQSNHNGPVGIWCACDCRNVVFRKSISRHNCTQPGGVDGDGFDIDGAVVGGMMEYNYSYENEGSGYLMCEYGSGLPWKNNHMRYCISIGDAWRVERQGALQFFGPKGLPLEDSRTERCLLVPAKGKHSVVNNEVGEGCTGLEVRNNVFVEGSVPAVREPDNPHITVKDNQILREPEVYERILEGVPRITEPRCLDDVPVWNLLEHGNLSEWLIYHKPSELFGLSQKKVDLFQEKPMLTYYLNGRDFEGSDFTGVCRQVYDHIKPGKALEIRAGADLWFPHPTWYDAPAFAVVLTARLRSPGVVAELYAQTDKERVAASISSSVSGYSQTVIVLRDIESVPRIGITVRSGEYGLLAETIQIYPVNPNPLPLDLKQLPVKTIGDVYCKDGCFMLCGSGSGLIGHSAEGCGQFSVLETEIEVSEAGGLLFVKQRGSMHIRQEILLEPGQKRYSIPLPTNVEYSWGIWNGSAVQDTIKVYQFALK